MKRITICPTQYYEASKVSELSKANLQTPECQRLLDENRVEFIYDSLKQSLKNASEPVVAGCLVICRTNDDQGSCSWLVDGNHRLHAYLRLLKEDGHDQTLMCNYILVEDEEEAERIFDQVNQSTPLPDLPKGVSMANPAAVGNHFQQKYKKIFSPSKVCRKPSLNLDLFIQAIARVFEQRKDLSAEDVIRMLEGQNTVFQRSSWLLWKRKGMTQTKIEECKRKATEKGELYFGMSGNFEWMNGLFGLEEEVADELVVEATSGRQLEEKPRKRPTISLAMRNCVAAKGTKNGELCCYCCKRVIHVNDMDVGHLISHHSGGSSLLPNLVAMCRGCNTSIGKKNVNEYMKEKGIIS